MNNAMKAGFVYRVETLRNGEVMDLETIHNLMPQEGINHMLSVLLLSGAQVSNWYIGLFENNYAPHGGDVMASFPALAGESTAYSSSERILFVPSPPVSGVSDNALHRAEFEFSSNRSIQGGFVSSFSGKGSTAGVLLSAVRFASPKQVEPGTILRITAGFSITSG